MKKIAAYVLVVIVAAFGAYRAESAQDRANLAQDRAATAQKLARAVDLRGDRSLCKSENKIRAKSNARDQALEHTAELVKEALLVISSAATTNDRTDAKLRSIARRARLIRTDFATEKLSKCETRFPREVE